MASTRIASVSATARRGAAPRERSADLALLWVPTVFLAAVGWAAFREYGWGASLALLAGGYLGRAIGDLAVGIGRPAADGREPGRGRRAR